MVVSSPLNEQQLRDMLYTASKYDEAAWAVRYPRGRSTGMETRKEFKSVELGKGRILHEGEGLAVLSFGPIGNYVIEARRILEKEGVDVGHFDMRFAKPLDTELIDHVLDRYDSIITIEDGTILGGFGSAVTEYVASKGAGVPVKIMGVPDRIVEHGTQRELHDEVGMGPDGIIEEIKRVLGVPAE
jgi:1-deoxy-D-xylulose-5-phosphate synthase